MSTPQYGAIVDVSTTNVGTTFAADAAASATNITLTDITIFDELPGQVYIDGAVYSYTVINLTTSVMTLATGLLTAAMAEESRAEIYPPAPARTALVDLGIEGSEAVRVTIPHAFELPDGVRPPGAEDVALLEERNTGELFIKDVMARGMITLGASENLDDYTSQGVFIQLNDTDAAGGTNYPSSYAGVLEVLSTKPTAIIVQRYTAYRNSAITHFPSMWTRAFGAGDWSAWKPPHPETPVRFSDNASSTLTITTTATLIPGLQHTFTPSSVDAVYRVDASIDFSGNNNSVGVCSARLYIDGAAEPADITFDAGDPAATARGSQASHWFVDGLSVASHTLEIRALGTSGVTGYSAHTNSKMSITQLTH